MSSVSPWLNADGGRPAGPGVQDGLSDSALLRLVDQSRLPRHVAIIMDGNGRWAQQRGLPRVAGHQAGVETLKRVVEAASQLGIEALTVYAFSTENWERPAPEVSFLMRLFQTSLRNELEDMCRNDVRFRILGEVERLPRPILVEVERALQATAGNGGLQLNVALNYGGRHEIVRAAMALAKEVRDGRVSLESIDEKLFARHLYTDGLPDPDLCIRTGGEHRISNFLLWQLAYAELWVTPVYWPDFQPSHFYQAILDFQRRQRRFGRVTT